MPAILLSLIASLIPAAVHAAADALSYFSDGQEIALTPSERHIALRLAAGSSPDPGMLAESLRGAAERDLPMQGIRLYTLPQELGIEEMTDLLSDLRSRPDVDLVAPAFDAPGALMIVSDQFIAQLVSGIELRELMEINRRHGVEILREAPWGERTYLLRVHRGDALATANAYHRLPQIAYAHPDFVRVMDRRPTASSRPSGRLVIGPDGRRLSPETEVPRGTDEYLVVERVTRVLTESERDVPLPPALGPGTIKIESFEGSFPNSWQLAGSPTWDDVTYRKYAGSWSGYGVGSGKSPPGPYPNNSQSFMVYGPFSLSNATGARADVQAWVRTQSAGDYLFLGASIGGSFSGIGLSGDWASATGGSGWMNVQFDFERDAGQDLTGQPLVWFAIGFVSDASGVAEGAYVDEVVIEQFTGTSQGLTNDVYDHLQWSLNNVGQSWGLRMADIRAAPAWKISRGNDNITVAIIDDGVDLTHPDLANKLVPGYDATGNGSGGGAASGDAHGTNCAGIAAAETHNGQGIAAIARKARIMPVRVFLGGATQDSWLADGINWATMNDADVLSNSWGGGTASTAISNAIIGARNNGRSGLGSMVVFASGNENGAVSYPARLGQSFAVGATSPCDQHKSPTSCDGEWWWGSNFGPQLDIAAPGVHMYSTDQQGIAGYDPGDYFYDFGGTSSAAPLVAGVAALVLGYDGSLTAAELEDRLTSTADDIGVPGFDNKTGHGRINALEALRETHPMPTLYISKEGTGSGVVTSSPLGIYCGSKCQERFPLGARVFIYATPDVYSRFVGWSGHPDCTNGAVDMDSGRSCIATFTLRQTYVLSISKSGAGSGTVVSSYPGINCGATCEFAYPFTLEMDLYGYPEMGSRLEGWSGAPDCSDGSVKILGAIGCTATFSPCPGASVLQVPPQTVSGTETFAACNVVQTESGGFEVGPTGNVTFEAGNRVILDNGFAVSAGGVFAAVIGAPVSP